MQHTCAKRRELLLLLRPDYINALILRLVAPRTSSYMVLASEEIRAEKSCHKDQRLNMNESQWGFSWVLT